MYHVLLCQKIGEVVNESVSEGKREGKRVIKGRERADINRKKNGVLDMKKEDLLGRSIF